jgi:predicted metal-dependent HD superfamily phosphohydrolase
MATTRGLLDAWNRLATRLGLVRAEGIGERLVRCYSERHRVFHTTEHLAQVLKVLREMDADDRLSLAAWFHDAIYHPGAADNEAQSAQLARQSLLDARYPESDVTFVADAVMATASHVSKRVGFAPLLDADLSILGASAVHYANYRAAIRAEYKALSDAAFDAGRKAFLQSILKRTPIYQTAFGQERFESRARQNLMAELQDLSPD